MTTAREREQILNEYGAWVEGKTLEGLDLSVEAYLEAVKAEENAVKVRALEILAGLDNSAMFRPKALAILGIKEEINGHRSR